MDTSINKTISSAPNATFIYLSTPELRTPLYSGQIKETFSIQDTLICPNGVLIQEVTLYTLMMYIIFQAMDPKTPTVQPPSPSLTKNKPLPPIPVPPTPEPPREPPSSVITGSSRLTGNNVTKRRKDRLTVLGSERVSDLLREGGGGVQRGRWVIWR